MDEVIILTLWLAGLLAYVAGWRLCVSHTTVRSFVCGVVLAVVGASSMVMGGALLLLKGL